MTPLREPTEPTGSAFLEREKISTTLYNSFGAAGSIHSNMAAIRFSKCFSILLRYLTLIGRSHQEKKCIPILESNRNLWLLHSHMQWKKLNENHFQKDKSQKSQFSDTQVYEKSLTSLKDFLLISNGFSITFIYLYTFCTFFSKGYI